MRKKKNLIELLVCLCFIIFFAIHGFITEGFEATFQNIVAILLGISPFLLIGYLVKKANAISRGEQNTSFNNTSFNNTSLITPNKIIVLKCLNCGSKISEEDSFCTNCGKAIEGNNILVTEENDNSPLVQPDPLYLESEDTILVHFLKEEFKKQNISFLSINIPSLNIKRFLLYVILFVTSIVLTTAYYFNYDLEIILLFVIAAIIITLIANHLFSNKRAIIKMIKKEPDRPIESFVSEIAQTKKVFAIPSIFMIVAISIIGVIIPWNLFKTPRLIYTRYGEGYKVFRYTRNDETIEHIDIPSEYKDLPVIAIGEKSFANTNIQTITLPDTLETIHTEAFKNAYLLEKIKIPRNVLEIRAGAFENCTQLKKVELPEGLETIRARAFLNNEKLYDIELPTTLTYLGASAFENCKSLTKITIPKGVIEINGATFKGCYRLNNVKLHDDIISIHGETFMGCSNLVSIDLPPKITEIRGDTFNGCSMLRKITIPEGVTRIGGSAFRYNRSLSEVYVPSTVREIGSSAFRGCRSLLEIEIPKTAIVNEKAFKESPTTVYKK